MTTPSAAMERTAKKQRMEALLATSPSLTTLTINDSNNHGNIARALTSLMVDRCYEPDVLCHVGTDVLCHVGTALTSLSIRMCDDRPVEFLSSLQKCTGLTSLDIRDSQKVHIVSKDITSFPPLKSLTITNVVLDCTDESYNDHIGDFLRKLESLAALESLTSLDVSSCDDQSVFRESLSLPSLTSLNFSSCDMENIGCMTGMTRLRSLNASSNSMYCLKGIAMSEALTSIDLSSCGYLSDIGPLAECTGLTSLDISSCSVEDIAPLAQCTALTSLDASNNPDLEELGPLACCTALESLNLSITKVRHVWALMACTALTRLDLSLTRVLDLTPLKAFTSLSLDIGYTPAWDVVVAEAKAEASTI